MSAILNRLQALFPEELTARARRARRKARTRSFSSQAAKRNARNDAVLKAVYDDFARVAEEAAMQSRRFSEALAGERAG